MDRTQTLRWLAWIGLLSLVLGLAALLLRLSDQRPPLTMQILSETNIDANLYRMVLISNNTRQALTCFAHAHSERFTGWDFGHPSRVCSLRAFESQLVSLYVQTNGPVSVTLVAAPIMSGWERWLESTKARLGLRPKRNYEIETKAD